MGKRIMFTSAYDGRDYVGWQMQPNCIAVEHVINKALSELLKEDIIIAGASRTDSGVHADGNVAVFDTETRIPADKICFALNQRLPKDIVCTSSCEVKPDFHPRHADCTKTYEYTIYNAVHPDPIKRRYSYVVYVPGDIDAIRRAAEDLKGERDFASFCSAHAQVKTTVRNIYSLDINQGDGSLIEKENNEDKKEAIEIDGPQRIYVSHDIKIRISGNGFLYNMVRIIVGTLVKVGYHFYPPEYVKTILDACDRTKAGPKAPAEGLKLVKIEYNPEDYLTTNY